MNKESINSLPYDWRLIRVIKVLTVFLLAFSSVITITNLFSPQSEILFLISHTKLFCYSAVFGISIIFFYEIIGVYEIANKNSNYLFLISIIFINFLCGIILVILFWLFEYENIGRLIITYIILLSSFFHYLLLRIFSIYKKNKNPIVFFDVSPKFFLKVKTLIDKSDNQFEIYHRNNSNKKPDIDILVKEEYHDLTTDLINTYLQNGTCVISIDRFCQIWCRCIPSDFINQKWTLSLDLALFKPFYNRIKRLIDLAFVLLFSLFLAPLLPLVIFVIILDSGFPIFYKQKRIGYLEKTFYLYKFRSMRVDSEENGPQWTSKNDTRVTKAGKYLRKYRIDELPQFWNILKGDMSLVGPRPERPEFDAELNNQIPYWRCRTFVKPGLTGWAQINSTYASDIDSSSKKLSYDLYYIKNKSFWLDLEIILSTLRSITTSSR